MLTEVPRAATGKIQRERLREIATNATNAEAVARGARADTISRGMYPQMRMNTSGTVAPVIVAARRTAVATVGKALAGFDVATIAAAVLEALAGDLRELGIGEPIDDVVLGNCLGPGGNPVDAFKVWQGGVSIHGAVIGVMLASWLYARAHKLNMWAYLDVMAPVAGFGIIGGRLGNIMNGTDTGGRLTNWPIGFTWPEPGTETLGAVGRFIFGADMWSAFPGVCSDGSYIPLWQCTAEIVRGPVHFTQLYGVFIGVAVLLVTFWALNRTTRPGFAFWQMVLWYSVLRAVFEDLHAHPEIGFQEVRTSGIVAEALRKAGLDEVHEGIGGTGVVGIIRGKGGGNRRIGLRADMDALPIDEETGLPYASKTPGVMHACGHDAHTTMLLGAAEYLAATRNFDGTAVVIFQPAEEGLGGARRMIAEGLFQRFPVDEVFGMHNTPNGRPDEVTLCRGAAMAGAAFFDITVRGRGSHAAMPQQARDALVIASALVGQLQTIVSRNVPPLETCVLSVTQIHAGAAYNVVPETATLAGTVRYFSADVIALVETRMRELCQGLAAAFGVEIELDLRNVFDVLVNDDAAADAALAAARDIVGPDLVVDGDRPATGSEDFADMLREVPGAYFRVGHAGTTGLHNPGYVLDPEILPTGASILARIIERRMPLKEAAQ